MAGFFNDPEAPDATTGQGATGLNANAPTNAAQTGGSQPYTGAPTDQNAIEQWFASMGVSDPKYWATQAMSKGGINDSGQYWVDLAKNTGALPGGQPQSQTGQAGGYGAAGALGAGLGGDLLTPYGGQFTAPTGTDDPGFQFAVQEGQKGIERSAAAKGTLLTGGTLKDLAGYTTGAALQNYDQAYNRANKTFQTNYDVFRNNQTDPFNKLYQTSNLGLNAASNYSNSLDRNTSYYNDATNPNAKISLGLAQGDITGRGAINQGNTYGSLANLGGTLAQDWFNRPRTTASA